MEMDALLKYQEIDRQIFNLEREVIASEISQQYALSKKKMATIKEDITKVDKNSAELMVKFQELETKIVKLSNELQEYVNITDEVNDEKQVDYCLGKISMLITEIDGAKKQLEKTNRLMDDTIKNCEQLMADYNQCSALYTEKKHAFEEYRNSFASQVIDLKKQLAELEKEMDDKILERYKNLRASKTKFPLVVELKGSVCQGCFVEAVGADVKMKETGLQIVECPSCGRLVYKK